MFVWLFLWFRSKKCCCCFLLCSFFPQDTHCTTISRVQRSQLARGELLVPPTKSRASSRCPSELWVPQAAAPLAAHDGASQTVKCAMRPFGSQITSIRTFLVGGPSLSSRADSLASVRLASRADGGSTTRDAASRSGVPAPPAAARELAAAEAPARAAPLALGGSRATRARSAIMAGNDKS